MNEARLVAAAAAAWEAAAGSREPRGSIKDYLLLVAQWLFGRPSLYWIPASLPLLGLGDTVYHEAHPVGGISTLAAGVLVRTMPLVPAEVIRRRATASCLLDSNTGPDPMHLPPDWEAGWLRYPFVLQRTAASVLRGYHVRAGVMRGYPKALAKLPGFGSRRLNPAADFPGADLLSERLVTIPTHRFVRSARVPAF